MIPLPIGIIVSAISQTSNIQTPNGVIKLNPANFSIAQPNNHKLVILCSSKIIHDFFDFYNFYWDSLQFWQIPPPESTWNNPFDLIYVKMSVWIKNQ